MLLSGVVSLVGEKSEILPFTLVMFLGVSFANI